MLRFCILLLVITLCGCQSMSRWMRSVGLGGDPDVLATTYDAADRLHSQLKNSDVGAYPMLAASFVDSSNLNASTDLGRLISEQIASRLSQHRYSVVEVQLRSGQLAIDPTDGVFLLSRDLAEISIDANAYSVLVGTYTSIENQVYINARILRAKDGITLASTDFSLSLTQQQKRQQKQRQQQRKSGAVEVQPSVQTSLE